MLFIYAVCVYCYADIDENRIFDNKVKYKLQPRPGSNAFLDGYFIYAVCVYCYADIDENRIFGNGVINKVISSTKPQPRPGSSAFL